MKPGEGIEALRTGCIRALVPSEPTKIATMTGNENITNVCLPVRLTVPKYLREPPNQLMIERCLDMLRFLLFQKWQQFGNNGGQSCEQGHTRAGGYRW